MRTQGTVRFWLDEEGWGVLDSPDTPGGCWTHFSHVLTAGYRSLGGARTSNWSGRYPARTTTPSGPYVHGRPDRNRSRRRPAQADPDAPTMSNLTISWDGKPQSDQRDTGRSR